MGMSVTHRRATAKNKANYILKALPQDGFPTDAQALTILNMWAFIRINGRGKRKLEAVSEEQGQKRYA